MLQHRMGTNQAARFVAGDSAARCYFFQGSRSTAEVFLVLQVVAPNIHRDKNYFVLKIRLSQVRRTGMAV